MWAYVELTEAVYGRFGDSIECFRCGQHLDKHSRAWSHSTKFSKERRYYCRQCYEELWF